MPVLPIPLKLAVQLLLLVSAAAMLKSYFSSAIADDLRWVLSPTAVFSQLITGEQFRYEAYAGYINADHTFLIASSCSGINFLITAFLLLSLSRLWRSRPYGIPWITIIFIAASSYAATVFANTLRVSTALLSLRSEGSLFGLDHSQAHRIEGITIYFGCLLLLFFIVERSTIDKATPNAKRSPRHAHLVVAIYYLTTLGIPMMNGAASQGYVFLEHAAFVILIPIAMLLAIAMIGHAVSVIKHALNRETHPALTIVKAGE